MINMDSFLTRFVVCISSTDANGPTLFFNIRLDGALVGKTLGRRWSSECGTYVVEEAFRRIFKPAKFYWAQDRGLKELMRIN